MNKVARTSAEIGRVIGSVGCVSSRAFRPAKLGRQRQCFRQTCAEPSAVSMSYDYAGQVAEVGPLASDPHPTQYELCLLHGELLTVPRGWRIQLSADAPVRPRSMDVIDLASRRALSKSR
jgi:Protein of unknown function (DUF3499)